MSDNWGAEKWREPKIADDETVIFSEHGRVLNKTCFRSHWHTLVKAEFGGYWLLTKHGGGEERFSLGYSFQSTWIHAAESMDSDQRYLLLHALYNAYSTGGQEAREATANKYAMAFLEGRLKRRKRNHRYYCEIVPKIIEVQPCNPNP